MSIKQGPSKLFIAIYTYVATPYYNLVFDRSDSGNRAFLPTLFFLEMIPSQSTSNKLFPTGKTNVKSSPSDLVRGLSLELRQD